MELSAAKRARAAVTGVFETAWRRARGRGIGASVAFAAAYWLGVRPRMLTWGATSDEVERRLPGDELLTDPDGESTMGITVEAPSAAIWPWLVQMGQDRGGFYSYEWAENLFGLDIHNADHVVTAYQDLSVGDDVRLGTADRFPESVLEVVELDPERALVLATPAEPVGWVWSFVLDPVDETTTRLLVRSRVRLPSGPVRRALARLALEPVTFVMTRGMLRGVRERAERLDARRGGLPTPEHER